jgi:hypothetical protein
MAKSKVKTPFPDEGLTKWMAEAETEPQTGDPDRNEQFLAKGGVVGDSKDEYVPDVPQAEKDMPHYNQGTPGVSGDSDSPDDFAIGDASDTISGMPLNQKDYQSPSQQPSQPVVKSKPLPGMPPTVTPDDPTLQKLFEGYKQDTEKYGPEQQMAVQDSLIKQRSDLPFNVGRSLNILGDTAKQVGGIEHPGGEQSYLDQANKLAGEKMGTMEKAQAGKSSQLQQQMKIAMDDPTSQLSKISQNSNRVTLKKLGWNDEQINKTSGNTIDTAAKNGLSFYEAEQTEGLKKATIEQTGWYQKQMAGNAVAGRQQEAAKTLNNRGLLRRATDAITGNPSTKVLEQQAAGGAGTFSPDVVAYASAHGITPEQAQIQKDRRTKGQ